MAKVGERGRRGEKCKWKREVIADKVFQLVSGIKNKEKKK